MNSFFLLLIYMIDNLSFWNLNSLSYNYVLLCSLIVSFILLDSIVSMFKIQNALKCKFRGEEQLLGPCLNCMKILHCIVCARGCVLLRILMHCHEGSMKPCIMDVVEKKLQILVIFFFWDKILLVWENVSFNC